MSSNSQNVPITTSGPITPVNPNSAISKFAAALFPKKKVDNKQSLADNSQIDKIVTNELHRITNKKKEIDNEIASQQRLVGFNNSFNARYSYYISMLYVLITALAIFIALSIVGNLFPIPSIIIDILVIILICGTAVILFNYYLIINSRSNMDFNELNLAPPQHDASTTVVNIAGGTGLSSNLPGNLFSFSGCIGSNCCGYDTVWDNSNNVCINKFNNAANTTIPTPAPMATPMTTSISSNVESFIVEPNSAFEFTQYSSIA